MRERRVVERRWAAAGPRRGPGLVRTRLERTGRDRGGAGARSDRAPARRCAATVVPDRPRHRCRDRGRSARPERVGGRVGRRRHRRRARVERSHGLWLVPGEGRAPRSHGSDRGDPVRARVAVGGPRARAGCGSRRGRRGVRERPRPAVGQPADRRPRVRRRDRPLAGPGDGRRGVLGRRRFALVRAYRRHRQRVRPYLARRAP